MRLPVFRVIILFGITFILTIGCLLLLSRMTATTNIQTQASENFSVSPTLVPPVRLSPKNDFLEKTIDQILIGTKGTYSIVIKNLRTGESYALKEHRVFQTASLYKLWIMATVYEEIENSNLNIDTVLSEDISVLNNSFQIASDSAEKTEGSISMTVEDALEKMVTVSDNYSALLLSKKIRLSKVSKFLQNEGLFESKIGTASSLPTVTANDMAMFYERLYNGTLGSSGKTEEMLDYLKRQQIARKIPKYIPTDVIIAHKTGELNEYSHDAGIVYTPHGDYIIVLMSESVNPPGAEEKMARISESVYWYFTNQVEE